MPQLGDGLGFVVVAMGVFGIGDIVANLEGSTSRDIGIKKVSGLLPTRDDLRRCAAPMLRGTALGSALGILPAAARRWPLSAPTRWKRRSQRTGSSSGTVPSRVLRPRKLPTMPVPRCRLFPC